MIVHSETRPRVLLVDDEPLILSAYRRTLNGIGADIVLAEDPTIALDLLRQREVDVVMADYRMPHMNGDAFLEHVRTNWPDTVRILVTAYADVQVVEEAVRRGGIFRFLTKPCDANKLRQALNDAIEKSKLNRETLRRSQQLKLDLHSYEHLFRSAPDPMMIADLDGYVVEVNDAFVTDAGDTRREALRRRPHVMSDRTQWSDVQQRVERAGMWSGEVNANGRIATLSISLITDDEGRPYAYAASEKDITHQRRLHEAERSAQYEVILALARLAEYRDPETGAHLERMRRYSQIIARQLSNTDKYKSIIDDDYVEAIFYSSPLHDIGKVGVPDAILLKPGKLTAEEWRQMQQHAGIGADVLSVTGDSLTSKTWLSMARTIALQHHEKIDGTGYPLGLKSDQIDLSARIVALADAYDAITSKRVYKDAIPHDVARSRILESCGTHFDPDVVDAFLATEDAFITIRGEFNDAEEDNGETGEQPQVALSS